MIDMSGINLQNREFDAVRRLAKQYHAITLTPVVDDDYPEVRHKYEGALRDFIAAIRNNGRLGDEERNEIPKEAMQATIEACGEGAEGTPQAQVHEEKPVPQDFAENVAGWQRAQKDFEESKKPPFVAQDWTRYIPMMQQTVLLGIVRGPDNTTKYHPVKPILRWYRRCLLLSALDGEVIDNPWDPRGGSFTGPSMPPPDEHAMKNNPVWWGPMQLAMDQFMVTMDEMPIHFWLHMCHAVEIMGVHHSDTNIRMWWTYVYERMVHAMHMFPEKAHQLNRRLGDDRDGWLERSDPAITK